MKLHLDLLEMGSSYSATTHKILIMTFSYKCMCTFKVEYGSIAILATSTWVKVFRINPDLRILRLIFHRKSASKCRIREIIIASPINFPDYLNTINHLNMKLFVFVGIMQAKNFNF